MSEKHLSETRFSELDLPAELMSGLAATGFEFCTPIQADSLPLLLRGEDVAGQAQTGTGKTAAFLLATFSRLLKNEAPAERHVTQPRALILAPTRELAIQIHSDAVELGRDTNLKMVLVYGGTGYDSQRKDLVDGVDILIGTPGRIIDYYRQGIFDLSLIEVAVLDEADRMFDLGFIKDVRYMLRQMPPPQKRLNMLFSATLSHRVAELAYEHMNEPTEVTVEAEKLTADNVKERAFYPSNDEKIPLLLGIMRDIDADRVVIFSNTKHMTETVNRWLTANGNKSGVISGDVPQKKRERLLEDFKAGKIRALVATDVAARGLHIPNVSHVINFDLPQDAEDYVHRIGRTARAGASGEAISFACEKYAFSMMDIEQYIGHTLPVEPVTPEVMLLDGNSPRESSRDSKRDSRGRDRSDRGGRGRSRDTQKPARSGRSDNRGPSRGAVAGAAAATAAVAATAVATSSSSHRNDKVDGKAQDNAQDRGDVTAAAAQATERKPSPDRHKEPVAKTGGGRSDPEVPAIG